MFKAQSPHTHLLPGEATRLPKHMQGAKHFLKPPLNFKLIYRKYKVQVKRGLYLPFGKAMSTSAPNTGYHQRATITPLCSGECFRMLMQAFEVSLSLYPPHRLDHCMLFESTTN
jgi:hypothetical protein